MWAGPGVGDGLGARASSAHHAHAYPEGATYPAMPYPWEHPHLRHHEDVAKASLVWSPAPEAAHAHASKPSPNQGGGSGTGNGTSTSASSIGASAAGNTPSNNSNNSATPNNGNTSSSGPGTTAPGAGTPPTPSATPGSHSHHNAHSHHAHGAHPHSHSLSHSQGGHSGAGSSSGAQGPPPQGLMHWMSVMAEHMSNPHHDVHYMWNGVESKMTPSEQSSNGGPMQKGGSLDDGRLDVGHSGLGAGPGLYGTGPRSTSSSSSSPPAASASSGSMLVVPQPISAKLGGGSAGSSAGPQPHANGTGRKYQCKMCPQIFMAKSAMQMHARDAHRAEAKPHQCQQCLKSFSSNHQLVQHIRVHTGEKPYRCSYCDRRFKQLSHVQQHTRLHTGERPYRCHIPECGRAFIQLSNLQQHLRNHDAQLERAKNRPFQCAICGKGFATESSLRTHTAKHAALIGGPNTTSCPVCHKLFLGPEALMEHMKQVHKEPGTSNMAGPNETSAAEGLSLTNPGSGSNAGSLQMSNQPNLLMHGHPGLQLPGQPGPGSTSGGLGQPSSGPAPAHLHNPHVQNSVPVPGTNPGPGSGSGNENWVIATPSVKRRAPTHACPVCGKHYVNEGSLRKHLAAHPETAHITSALRMWPCSICPAVFPHENGLLTHMEQMRMEPKHQFAAQYMLSRAAAERRFRDRGESPGPGNGSNSAQQGSTGAGTGGQDDGHMDDPSNVGSPAPASPGGSINQAGAGGQNMVQPRLTSPSTRSPAPSSAMTGPSHFVAPQPMMNIGMQGNEMEEDAAPLTPEEAAVARRIQQAGMEAVLRLAAASATTAGVGVGVPSGAGVSYQDTRLEQAIRLHQALGFPLPQPHPLHLHQQQLQFQQHQQHQSHHQQQLPQHQQPLHHGQQQQQQHQQSYNQQLQHHLSHQQPPQGH